MVRATAAAPGTADWPKPAVITAPSGDLQDVNLSLGADNGITLSWIRTTQPRDVGIYRSWRPSQFVNRAWLPMLLH